MMEIIYDQIIELNNQAAVYLFDSTTTASIVGGQGYHNAIRMLKTSLNLSRTLFMEHQPGGVLVQHHHHETKGNTTTSTSSSNSLVHCQFLLPSSSTTTTTTTMMSGTDGSSTTAACYSSCFVNQSCSSSRPNATSSFLFTSPIVLIKQGRTTRSEPSPTLEEVRSSLEMISSIMIYNMALAHHLLAVRCYNDVDENNNKNMDNNRSRSLLQVSSQLYEKAIEMSFPLMLQGGGLLDSHNNNNNGAEESSSSSSCWISLYLIAILFNQGHAYDGIGNTIQSDVLYEQLLTYISSICTTTNKEAGRRTTTTQEEEDMNGNALSSTSTQLHQSLLDVFLYNISLVLDDKYNNRFAPAA